jgi:nucleoside-diphosphate-sugar epimerase
MKILVTGNLGYIGSVLTGELKKRNYSIVGYDTGFFEDCTLGSVTPVCPQIRKDIRDIEVTDFEGIDAVIHLAALSNDPLGELDPGLTEEINLIATIRCAEAAKTAGVKRFVYSSSQSMYGLSDLTKELDEYDSEKNPVTEYARTKWAAEQELNRLVSPSFHVTSFRPSTVFGASARLRCDIVFNNFVACAYTTSQIEIKSDGSPWRPVVHVKDVAAAFIAGLEAPSGLISGRAFNVGLEKGNFTVRQLAEAVVETIPNCSLIFTGEHGLDSRTYRVSFKRILNELRDYYEPKWSLLMGGQELCKFLKKSGFVEETFRGPACNRLQKINYLLAAEKLSENLRWR